MPSFSSTFSFRWSAFVLLVLPSIAFAQSPLTNLPIPPLQWLELTPRLSGSGPPALRDASIGFDESSRTIILFGGEVNGIPVQQTFLLDTASLNWSTPSPAIGFEQRPPPRSAAIGGIDIAASNRHGHVIIGGKGLNGQALGDAWEYDFINQFWSRIQISPGGPAPRWGASGGTDPRALPVSDAIVPGPNNTFYLAGGFDGSTAFPLSDAWIFRLAGVLGANNPNSTVASWSNVNINSNTPLPSKVRQGGIVMPSARVVAAGGCTTDDFNDNTCAQQDSYVLNIGSAESISPGGCPAPRVGPVLIPNYNRFANNFASQTFMALGTFNDSFWDDDNGLERGEVAVLDIETGTWARLLPAGDPGSSPGRPPRFPLPREGAAAISFPSALVGSNPSVGSDTIIFGGQLANGTYMNDVWLLRAYMGALTETNQTWSGFGDGTLQTGQDAAGGGVTVEFMTTCAKAITPPPQSGQPLPTGTPLPPDPSAPPDEVVPLPFDTSVTHKALSPISVALVLGAIIAFRCASPSIHGEVALAQHSGLVWAGIVAACAAYAAGIIGFVVSFTSITTTSPRTHLQKRDGSPGFLQTTHARAGFAFFVGLYAVFPIVVVTTWYVNTRSSSMIDSGSAAERSRKDSVETGTTALGGREKNGNRRNVSPSQTTVDNLNASTSPTSSPRQRAMSWQGGRIWPSLFRRSSSPQRSNESVGDSPGSNGAARSFEVLNRGPRVRRQSGYGMNGRSLSDLSWLDRRRSLNAVVGISGELDYALTQLNVASNSNNVLQVDTLSTRPLTSPPNQTYPIAILPSKLHSFLHILLHALLFGISVVTLVVLWERAPMYAFIIFVAWVIAFYAAILLLAWHGRPRESILTVLVTSIRHHKEHTSVLAQPSTPQSSRPLSTVANDSIPFPGGEGRSPYTYHQPLYRGGPLSNHDDEVLSSSYHGGSRAANGAEEDEDEELQRRIEQEMERRDVSIVTVPKRRLWIANPS